ncbi:hypothetical protein GIB67_028821 [Kingdonia uniflora]|uniref:Aldehyde dehydrogenase domain-containing protein n=1 Tax=Kingdonia uniflora TaxID=39325 RepID=A0A7J7LT35_9MAGN|nr:hypothetical protein GIB67_028821 [Kingdonia uniflora]
MLQIMRFFTNLRKPMILALARPNPKKNLITLVKAFRECRPLRELANLVSLLSTLIMGNREGIDEMSNTNSSVLVSILKIIDKYDLFGQVAYPKHHKQSDVPDIYRLAAKTKDLREFEEGQKGCELKYWLEVNRLQLTVYLWLPQKMGGPVDIHRVLDNGLLVDPHDQQGISAALLKLVDKQLWAKYRQHGLKNIHLFSWPEHCKIYLSRIASCRTRHPRQRSDDGFDNSDSDSPGDSLRDIQGISLNLKLSMDSGSGSLDNALDSEENAVRGKIEKAALNLGIIPPIKELRKSMRIQAFRCYCQNGTKLRAIPVLASPAQALCCIPLFWITFQMEIAKPFWIFSFRRKCQGPEHELAYTGSMATEKVVLELTCKINQKPVTLELGRKFPFIVREDADIDKAVGILRFVL